MPAGTSSRIEPHVPKRTMSARAAVGSSSSETETAGSTATTSRTMKSIMATPMPVATTLTGTPLHLPVSVRKPRADEISRSMMPPSKLAATARARSSVPHVTIRCATSPSVTPTCSVRSSSPCRGMPLVPRYEGFLDTSPLGRYAIRLLGVRGCGRELFAGQRER